MTKTLSVFRYSFQTLFSILFVWFCINSEEDCCLVLRSDDTSFLSTFDRFLQNTPQISCTSFGGLTNRYYYRDFLFC